MTVVQEKTGKVESGVSQMDPASPDSDYLWLDIVLVLLKHRGIIAKLTIGAALLSIIVSLILPVEYTARTTILPPKENNSITSLFLNSQLGGLASLAGGPGGLLKDSNDMYVSMIKSRTVVDGIIHKLGLMSVYHAKTLTAAEEALAKRSKVTTGADSIITIEVDDRDPSRAADIANAYSDGLSGLSLELLNQSASRRRAFMEDQLDKAKAQLVQAESDLKATQEKTGLIALTDQAKAIIENVARLRAQMSATQVKLESMQSFATPQNPEVVRLQSQLEALRAQLQEMQQSGSTGSGNVFLPTSKVPSVGLQYADKLRSVKYSEALVEQLAKQYELALLDESSTISAIQVLDRASVPERKSKPQRGLIVFLTTLTAFLSGIALAFVLEHFEEIAADPAGRERLQKLKMSFATKRHWLKLQ